ncbi:urease accessory protein UreH [Metabacillus herbersteinensis]|uniref:Urease accessory protein UreH n=1 Tax=Metabacillus herbersteinensis TaxID=283816 RepID=A0ABV6GGT0_9BACI
MDVNLLTILAIGFALGIKHSIEPDHIIAVSTMASKTKKLWNTSLTGVFWGIGHTATLFIAGILLIGFKVNLTEKWALTLEMLVGFMLVYLGIKAILSRTITIHEHRSAKQTYIKSAFIGFIHGLAGSSAMVLLTLNTIDTLWQGAVYIIIFGLGTCIGMLLFTSLLGIPFSATKSRHSIHKTLTQLTGGISAVFGLYYVYNLGINEGLFALWFL